MWGSPGHLLYEALAQHPSCRTATIWRSLSPFWGEEYTVHLPLDFHHLAVYVLDEDTVGCVMGGWGVHGDPKSHANLHTKKTGAASNP